jgi:hypothetical protein
MHKVSLALAVVGTSMTLLAQNCNTSPPASSLETYTPPSASFYYPPTGSNSLSEFFDLNLQSPVAITSIDLTTYAQGAGNPVVPTQIGNVAEVRIYMIPGTRVGNEGTPPVLPHVPGAWHEVARGDLTIVAWNSYSPITNFRDPVTNTPFPGGVLALDPGNPLNFDINRDAGVCIEIIPTDYYLTPVVGAPNVGPVPVIGFVDPNPTPSVSDQFMTIDETAIRNNGWWHVDPASTPNAFDVVPNAAATGAGTGRVNMRIGYTPDPSAAISIPFGKGCYDGRRMIYEQFPDGLGGANPACDLVNTSYTFSLQNTAVGAYYNVVSSGVPYDGATAAANGTNLTAGAFTVSSSASWDDASVDVAITSGPIVYPGNPVGVSTISVNSNGKIAFGPGTDPSFAYNGANYGSTGPFADLQASFFAFNTDMDPTDPTFPSSIYVEQPSPNLGGIRITWAGVYNWPAAAGATNDVQLEISPGGNLMFLSFGPNLATGAPATGNDGIVGFSAGNGETASDPIDWSAIPAGNPGQNSGDGSVAPVLSFNARPVAGTSVDLVIDNVMPATNGFFTGFITASLNYAGGPGPLAPLNVAQYGLPGCTASVDIFPPSSLFTIFVGNANFPAPATEGRWTWNVPQGTNGLQVFFQGGTLTPGQNVAGILVSNAICAKVGT